MVSDAHRVYWEGEILQADRLELVRLLYRAAIESISRARQHLADGDIRARSAQISRAQEIVAELAGSLDHQQGGNLAASLLKLYDYVLHLLQTANFEQTAPPLAEAEALLATLYDGWQKCAIDRPGHGVPAPVGAAVAETGLRASSCAFVG